MKLANVRGIQLSYIEKGTGTPLVLIHGSLNDYRSWQFQIDPFAAQHHVVAYSRRNHFPNKWTEYPADYSVATERDDLEGFIEALGLETPVHLVGSSYGAYIAALVERDYPKIGRSAVLGEPPIESLLAEDPASSRIYSASEAKFAKIVLVPIRNGDYEAAVRGFIDSATGDGAFDRLPTGTKEMMLQNSRTLAAELPTPERDSFTAEDAKTISAPTLLVKGQNSAPTFQRISCRFWRNRCQMRAPPSSRTPLTFHMLQMPGFTTR